MLPWDWQGPNVSGNPYSVPHQVGRYQSSRDEVNSQAGFFQGDHAQQAGFSLFGEDNGSVELFPFQPDGHFSHVNRDDPASARCECTDSSIGTPSRSSIALGTAV